MTSIAGIVLALVLLMALAYRGVSVLLLAPIMALLATLFSPQAPLLASYTQVFMPALGGFVIAFFPLFLLGAVFGKLMEASGAARVIAHAIVAWLGAQRAILAVVLACAVLTYGGVSLFVVAFAVYPIAAALFRQADLPKRLIPATIALGAFTFTMTALPGTPSIQNAIPMPYFGTTPFAAPGLGLIG
ncbi:MAG: GntP family permease, partial [Hydrogenophaga sp.]|nr:GntP family permease [Hydrogenophaga sp.]